MAGFTRHGPMKGEEKHSIPEIVSIEGAKSAISAGDRIAADRILGALTGKDPKDASAWALKGENCLVLSRFEEAKSAFAKAAELEPGNLGTLLGLGKACLKLKDYNAAIDAYEKAVTADRAGSGAHLKLASAFIAAGKEKEAIKVLKEAGATMPDWGVQQLTLKPEE